MSAAQPELPPVPYPFITEPETYHMAVRWYLNTVTMRAIERKTAEKPTASDFLAVLRDDAVALQAATERGEPV